MTLYDDTIAKLKQYAFVRDRNTEHEVRTITITDDEAAALLEHLEKYKEWVVE